MIKRAAAISFAFFAGYAAHAQDARSVETITVPSIGGLYCLDPEDIVKMATRQKPDGKCGVIPGGSTIIAAGVKSTNGFKGGFGLIDGINNGKGVAFLLVEASGEDAPPKNKMPFDHRTFKFVSPVDIEATPEKWKGRDIEFRNINVYWVSDTDVRFITASNITVFASEPQGVDAAFFKENCETAREALSPKCRATIRFAYHWHGEDNPTSRSTRVILKTNDVQVLKRRR